MNKRYLKPIEFEVAPENYCFMWVVSQLSQFKVLQDNAPLVYKELEARLNGGYNNSLLLVIKNQMKLWTRNDYPFNLPFIRAREPEAQVIIARLNLWEGVLDNTPLPYKALHGWCFSELESKIATFESEFYRSKTLEGKVVSERKMIQALKNNSNPYSSSNPLSQHTYNLHSAALAIKQHRSFASKDDQDQQKEFISKAWKPYLSALMKHAKTLEKGAAGQKFGSYRVENDHLSMLLGGRQTEKIFPENFLVVEAKSLGEQI